jgi:hypothetical protein
MPEHRRARRDHENPAIPSHRDNGATVTETVFSPHAHVLRESRKFRRIHRVCRVDTIPAMRPGGGRP